MDGLIYNQKKIPKGKWRYGLRSSAATGCGWIATHNALRLLGHPSEPEQLIRYYRRRFPLLNGTFGTFRPNLAGFFRRRGFHVRTVRRRREFDEAARNGGVCILYFWWRDGLRVGTHYAAVQYENGKFVGYNTYRNSTGPDPYGPSLEAFLRRRGYFWPALLVISKP